MRLIITTLFLSFLVMNSFSQEDISHTMDVSEEFDIYSTTPDAYIELDEKNDTIIATKTDIIEVVSPTSETPNLDYPTEEEIKDSDFNMRGVFRAVGVASVTFIGCLAGIGGTIWICLKARKSMTGSSN